MKPSSFQKLKKGGRPVIKRMRPKNDSRFKIGALILTRDGLYRLEELTKVSSCVKRRMMILRPVEPKSVPVTNAGVYVVLEMVI